MFFSARPVKPKKKSAPAEMFGIDDLSDHGGSTFVHLTNNPCGLSSSDDIVPLNTDQPDWPRAKGREVSAVCLNQDTVFLTGKFDPILHLTESPVSNHWTNLTVVNSLTSLPVNYVLADGSDRDSSLRAGLQVNLSTGKDRTGQQSPTKSMEQLCTGSDRTGYQSPEKSTRHGTA